APFQRTEPDTFAASGRSDTVDSAVSDLPEPDSPTSASVSPCATWRETLRTASTTPSSLRKVIERSRMSSSGPPVRETRPASTVRSFIVPSSEGLARVEGIAHALEHEHHQRQHYGEGEECGERQPGILQMLLALERKLAQRRIA